MTDECERDRLLAQLPETQDSYGLVDSANDRFVANARTLLHPLSESEGVLLRAEHDSRDMPDIWFSVDGDELRAVSRYSSGVTGEVDTGLDAVIRFAHAYGHERHEFHAELSDDGPEVLLA